MDQKFKLDDKEYEIASLSEKAKKIFVALQFASNRIEELENMQALLQRAKNSYVYGIKKEILSNKSGLTLEND